jgi:hypothetical protein
MAEEVKPNPFGANGTTSDPREQTCWDNYVKGIAVGIENAYKAAIEAGYSEDHSRNITLQGWFNERLRKLKLKGMLQKSERNLDRALDVEWENDEGKIQPDVMRIVVDVSKTVSKSLGKDDWSERNELTGKDGKPIEISQITGMKIQEDGTNISNKE